MADRWAYAPVRLISAVLLIIMAVLFALPALLLVGYLMLVFR